MKTRTRRPAVRHPHVERAEDDTSDRLQKVLAAAGLGSRRDCEELIRDGRIEVDGKVVTELGTRVDRATQVIRVDGEALPQPKLAYIMIHKPEGVVTTNRDPSGRPRVIDLLPPTLGRLFPVGRLDMSSEGLILVTNDGELANRLTHPRYGIEKTYHVQVAGRMEPETLVKLRQGMYLAEGFARVVRATIKNYHKQSTVVEMVLDEGRNREVRRLLARVGHKVQRLLRIGVGPLRLGDLPSGAYRPLERDEVQTLRKAVREAQPRRRGEPRTVETTEREVKQSPERAADDSPKPARSRFAQARENSERVGRPTSNRPAAGRPAAGRTSSARPATGRPATGRPATGRPTAGRPATTRPSNDRPATARATTTRAATGRGKPSAAAQAEARTAGSGGRPTKRFPKRIVKSAPARPLVGAVTIIGGDIAEATPVERPAARPPVRPAARPTVKIRKPSGGPAKGRGKRTNYGKRPPATGSGRRSK